MNTIQLTDNGEVRKDFLLGGPARPELLVFDAAQAAVPETGGREWDGVISYAQVNITERQGD
jgi:hypothetical protein